MSYPWDSGLKGEATINSGNGRDPLPTEAYV